MSTSAPTSRPSVWRLLAVALLLLASIGLHVYVLRLNRESNAELATRFVSVEDYNNLVRAQNRLTILITNLQTLFGEHRTGLARLAGQFDRLDGACLRQETQAWPSFTLR